MRKLSRDTEAETGELLRVLLIWHITVPAEASSGSGGRKFPLNSRLRFLLLNRPNIDKFVLRMRKLNSYFSDLISDIDLMSSLMRNRRNQIMMVFMTIMALLFVQTLPLHAHNPHGHNKQLDQMGVLDKHEHHSEIHVGSHVGSSDVDDAAHGPVTEIDLSVPAVIKNLKFSDTLVAVLTFFILLFVPLLISTNRWSINLESPFITRGIVFRPPLRAPPL